MNENPPIREICEQYELTQAGLAKRFGIPIRTVEQWCTGKRQPPEYVVSMIRDLLENEVKHGKWLLEREPNGKPYCFHCSVCDDDFHHIGITVAYDYCPNCGARMDSPT